MGGHKITNQKSIHFLTFTIVGWVDVFTRKIYKDIIIESLRYCIENKELRVHAYIIMSNHIHIIASTESEIGLSGIVRDFKKYTASRIIKEIEASGGESRREWMLRLFKYYAKYNKNNTTYQFWRRGNKPIELLSDKWIAQKVNYIHNNPIRAGIVQDAEHYTYSSAIDYFGTNGILPICLL